MWWLRRHRHSWRWTGSGYQSTFGGWRNEKVCGCGAVRYVCGPKIGVLFVDES